MLAHGCVAQERLRDHLHWSRDIALAGLPPPHGAAALDAHELRETLGAEAERFAGGFEVGGGQFTVASTGISRAPLTNLGRPEECSMISQ